MRATEGHRDVPASSGKGQSDVLADPRGRTKCRSDTIFAQLRLAGYSEASVIPILSDHKSLSESTSR